MAPPANEEPPSYRVISTRGNPAARLIIALMFALPNGQIAAAMCATGDSPSTRNHWSAKRALSRFWWTSDLVQANGLACSL
jgi:hypothetical protein